MGPCGRLKKIIKFLIKYFLGFTGLYLWSIEFDLCNKEIVRAVL